MERASGRYEDDGNASAPSFADEERLIESARALGEEAWAEIYRRHAQQVYGYIYFRLGDQHTAEDLAADVFVKAIAGIKSYAYRGTPLLAWLYRIAHNVTVDHRKAAARHMQHHSDAPADDIEEREDALALLDDRSDMLSAIRALTEEQQQVILLRFYQGLTNAEVAAVMGKPEGAVKALQSRGLRSLRRLMGAGVQEATA
jgi:RNA polymerase sigma-70 factor (ECF subfamily)